MYQIWLVCGAVLLHANEAPLTLECDGYQECARDLKIQINDFPICCNGELSCDESKSEHKGPSGLSSFIRCDGVDSCFLGDISNFA